MQKHGLISRQNKFSTLLLGLIFGALTALSQVLVGSTFLEEGRKLGQGKGFPDLWL
jgi:hypothetical protein